MAPRRREKNTRTFKPGPRLNGVRASNPPLAGFLRVRRIAGAVSLLTLAGAGAFGLAAIFSRQAMVGAAAVIALAVCVFAHGVIETCRVYFLWHTGAWVRLNGQPVTREQQPARFRIWLTLHGLFGVIYVGAAGFLTWTVLDGP